MAEIETTEAPKGLDAIISGAIDAAETAPEAAEAPAQEQTTDVKIDATGRAHGADGKFASKDSAEPKASVTDGQAKAAATVADQSAPDTAPPAQQVQMPEAWSAEWKAKVATLPPEQQALVVDQYKAFQSDYTRKSQEVAEQRKTHEPLFSEVQRQAPFLQQIGYTPERFLQESAVVAQRLMMGTPEQKGDALAYLAQLHQVPPEAVLRSLGVSITQDGQAQAPSPELQQLRQQVFQTQQTLQQFQQQAAQNEQLRAQAEFEAIGQSKDESGQLKYPHFGRVRETMVRLVANDIAQDWDRAYAIAVRGDDELYHQTVAAERQRVEAKAEADRLAAVEKAKKAGPVKTSTSAPGGGTQLKGLDAHLAAALDRAGVGN